MANKTNETGVIEGVNDNGVKVNGRWLNFSRYFKGTKTPAKGSSVQMVVDEFNGKDYVNELTVVGGGVSTNGTVSTASGNGGYAESRNSSIERQVAFKGAIELASNGVITVDEVAKYTDQFDLLIKAAPASVEDAA